MKYLIKQARIICPHSEYHDERMDILISDGKITSVHKNIVAENNPLIVKGNNLHCCIGLCDIGTHSGEPGYEHRENIESLKQSAFAGGYTHLAIFPNTNPVIQSQSEINFLHKLGQKAGIAITIIGALSKDIKGEDINEYLDMHQADVSCFSDGLKSVKDAGLLIRALQYISPFGGTIIHHPEDAALAGHGQMHEGIVSTGLGLPGVPDIAELNIVRRDILLQQYTGSPIIEHCISAESTTDVIRSAKLAGLSVSATVAYLNLIFSDEALQNYDTNLKVSPVLRAQSDKSALIQALKDDTVDAIVSNHVPLEEELKQVEFPYAAPGATGLETCLISCLTYLSDQLEMEKIIYKLTVGPRKLLNVSVPDIKAGESADLCIFDTEKSFDYSIENNQSRSKNNPHFGTTFSAKVVATFYGEHCKIAELHNEVI